MNGMWFALGVLCGVVVSLMVVRRGGTTDGEKTDKMVHTPTKGWGETRNFLYYDGTEMPVVKEEINE